MAARPIDAAEGYRLFLDHHGEVELDEINEYLQGIRLRPVSPRMYMHYQKLRRYGYSAYIPINRLDIAVASDHAWSDETRGRYSEVRQPVEAEVIWDTSTYRATVDGLGIASATLITPARARAGDSLILRLLATDITRMGTVVRSDPRSGRLHIAFDPYTSVPVAAIDSPFRGRLVFNLEDDARSVVTVTDLMLKVDRLLSLVPDRDEETELVRLSRVSLNSPFELVIQGGVIVSMAVLIIQRVVHIRKEWYEGTKTRYEAEAIQLDTLIKRRQVQLEADQDLSEAVAGEFDAEVTPLLDRAAEEDVPRSEPSSPARQAFISTFQAAIELPVDVQAKLTDQPLPEDRQPQE